MIRRLVLRSVVCLAVTSGSEAGARSAGAQRTEAGARLGQAWSSVTWDVPGPDDSYANQHRRTVGGGMFVRRTLWRGVSLQPELLVARKGFERTEPTVHSAYLEAPLLLRADAAAGAVRLFLLGGPAVAYEVACRVSYRQAGRNGRDCNARGQLPPSTATRAVDVSAVLGGGIAVRAGRGGLVVDARHTRGLRDVGDDPLSHARMLNRSTAVSLGYGAPLGR